MTKDTKKERVYAVILDQAEIAVRIIEGITETYRPEGTDAVDLLSQLEDDRRDGVFRASKLVAEYLYEQIIAAGVKNPEFHVKSNKQMN